MERIELFDLPIDNVAMSDAVASIRTRLDHPGFCRVSFINADCVNLAYRDAEYRQVLATADLSFADGTGMRWAGRCLGRAIVDNVNGTDLFPILLQAMAGRSLFLLGARPGVAQAVADWIHREFPQVVVAGTRDGYFAEAEEREVVQSIARSGAELLMVAMGAPRQEKWIARHAGQLGVKVAIGVGGLFGFYSGRIPRAPLWFRRMGIEWCWRWYQEPRRLCRRYLIGNPLFLARLLLVRMGTTSLAAPEPAEQSRRCLSSDKPAR
jgi:N-acetylglucosaminyldiphosphoundecaprenol N-acetyl-beta-D-mannosaminyltransferase